MNLSQIKSSAKNRIVGLDFARGIAVWGMLLMNFKIVMSKEKDGVLGSITHFMEGHYGVMFVILAGIGISLYTKSARATGDRDILNSKRKTLLKRSCFLMVIGLLFSFIWPADILHFYGVYIAIGVIVVNFSKRAIILLISIFTLMFPILFVFISYDKGWNWSELSYIDFWSVKGFIRNTFYNGFHPVFPWVSFLFLGLLFGRIEFNKKNLVKYLIISTVIAVVTEVLAHYLVATTQDPLSYLFSRDAMPPSPLFVISAGAEGIIMITGSMLLAEVLKRSQVVKPLVYTGQMVLTHYITHVFFGMGFLELIGRLTGQTLLFSIGFSTAYFVIAVVASNLWGDKFKRGPIELLMRRICG